MRFSWSSAAVTLGVVTALSFGGGALLIGTGNVPTRADERPPTIEKLIAQRALHAAVQRFAPRGPSPLADSDGTLTQGARLYAQNCAVCHGVSDGHTSTIAAGLYQAPPQFAKHGVDDDPVGETYWKIRHGIRFTGMPAYSGTLSDNDAWAIALFLHDLPHLPPNAKLAWHTMRMPGQLSPLPSRQEMDVPGR